MKLPTLRSRRVVAGGVAIAASVAAASGLLLNQVAFASTTHASGGHGGSAKGLGQLSGFLSPDKFTLGSAIDINLSNETARLPIYQGIAYAGTPQAETVWYLLLDASDSGLADDLGVNFAPKLANIAHPVPRLRAARDPRPTRRLPRTRSGRPTSISREHPTSARPAPRCPDRTGSRSPSFSPGSVAGPGYSPFIQIDGSPVVYNAPIIATGNGPFDVVHHTNTEDRVLGIHIAPPAGSPGAAPQGQFFDSWADLLFVKGFDAGQPIVYLSTDAGQPLTAVLERSTYVPALNDVSFNGGDDFLGSARERLFGFINGQTGANNPKAQGFQHLVLDGFVSEDASAGNLPHDQRLAPRRRSPQRLRRLPHLDRLLATPTPTARSGTPSSVCGLRRRSAKASTPVRPTRTPC